MADTDKAAIVAKYRDTERFKKALGVIKPDSSRQAECEYDVAAALWGLEVAAKIDKFPPPTLGQHKKDLQNLTTTLQRAIKLAAKAFPPEYQIRRGKDSWIGEELDRCLRETEQAIDWVSKRVKGSPTRGVARTTAVDDAIILLKRYGKRPTLYRVHKLAKLLLGNERADLRKYLKPQLAVISQIIGR
jgi:hypothetical protein